MNYESIGIICMSLILCAWSSYYLYLAWAKPEKFRTMAEKSLPLYGNSSAMKRWISSPIYIWFVRLTTFLGCLLSVVFFIYALRQLLINF